MSTKNPANLFKFIVVDEDDSVLSSTDVLATAISSAKNEASDKAEEDAEPDVDYEIGVYKLVKIVTATNEMKPITTVTDFEG